MIRIIISTLSYVNIAYSFNYSIILTNYLQIKSLKTIQIIGDKLRFSYNLSKLLNFKTQ